MSGFNYKDAGVDIAKGDQFVEFIKSKLDNDYQERVHSGVGGFAALYKITEDKLIAASTDGVGTKIKIAQRLNQHDTVGIDLVAMCVNDLLCVGARPLFFMDYLAMGKLDLEISQPLVMGVKAGCNMSQIPLIGGETAELPSMYPEGEYDLAGFAIGEVLKKDVIDGMKITAGDAIVALPSTGLHSNGFSLARKLIAEYEIELMQTALAPTKIYTPIINHLMDKQRDIIHGMSNITGGGVYNIPRQNSRYDYILDNLPLAHEIAPIYEAIESRAKLDKRELYKTFNMGIGFCIITSNPDQICSEIASLGEKSMVIGHVIPGTGQVKF